MRSVGIPTGFWPPTIYRDGEGLKSIARQPSQRVPMYLLLSVFGFRDGAPPVSMKVDYVRIYLPPS